MSLVTAVRHGSRSRSFVVRMPDGELVVVRVVAGRRWGPYRKYYFWVNGVLVCDKLLPNMRAVREAVKEVVEEYLSVSRGARP